MKVTKHFGAVRVFTRPCTPGIDELDVLLLSNFARPSTDGQLVLISDLLFGHFKRRNIFHFLSWTSHVSKIPAKSSDSAEMFTFFNEGRMYVRSLYLLI